MPIQGGSRLGPYKPVLESEHPKSADDWSPDGCFVVYDTGRSGGAAGSTGTQDLWVAPLDGDRKPIPFLVRPFTDVQAQISPDGRWIACSSDESGTPEAYVQDFPKPTGKGQVSTEGGAEPRWRRDGRELFYIAGRELMAADVRTDGAAFHAGVPRVLFEANLDSRTAVRNRYVVSPDGQRFLIIAPAEQACPAGRPQLAVAKPLAARYSKMSSTGKLQPGRAGSASARSPRR